VDGPDRDELSSARDRAADQRDAHDRNRDAAAAARDAAADARDESAMRRERFARSALWADEVRSEALRRECEESEARTDARFEQALLDSEVARSRAAMIREEFRAFLDEMRRQRIDAKADRNASRQDRVQSGSSRHQAAQDRQAAAQDRYAAAAERECDEIHQSAVPAGEPIDGANRREGDPAAAPDGYL
jgi:hypothetical protein